MYVQKCNKGWSIRNSKSQQDISYKEIHLDMVPNDAGKFSSSSVMLLRLEVGMGRKAVKAQKSRILIILVIGKERHLYFEMPNLFQQLIRRNVGLLGR